MNRSEVDARESLEDLAAAVAAVRRIAGLIDTSVLAQRAAQELQHLVGNDLNAVAVREGPDELAMRGVAGARTADFARIHVPRGAGIGGKILLVKRPIAVTDYEHDATISRDFVDIVAHGEGIHAMLGVPLEFEGEVVGVLYTGVRSSVNIGDRLYSRVRQFAHSFEPLLGTSLQSSRAVQFGVEEERQRIATQLHDTIGQLLFGIGISAHKARGQVPDGSVDLAADLERIEIQASHAASYLRDALRALTPSSSQEALATVIRADAAAFTNRSGIPADLVVIGDPCEVPLAIEAALLSVVREGLHNVEKHAAASSVVLGLYFLDTALGVTIQDDGSGVPEDLKLRPIPAGGHWGLATLLQRVERVGGTLTLVANEDGGATLRADFPPRPASDPA
jgi:LuxR family transcriptional regulator, regulator of acetate metabolism